MLLSLRKARGDECIIIANRNAAVLPRSHKAISWRRIVLTRCLAVVRREITRGAREPSEPVVGHSSLALQIKMSGFGTRGDTSTRAAMPNMIRTEIDDITFSTETSTPFRASSLSS
jgi:hypothetical protein